MLDELPRTDVGNRFTQTTIEMVAVSLADHQAGTTRSDEMHDKIAWALGGVLSLVAAFFGYVLVAAVLHSPNRQLVKDLSVIENLDEYRAAEDIEFLRALEREGLFTVEVDSEL